MSKSFWWLHALRHIPDFTAWLYCSKWGTFCGHWAAVVSYSSPSKVGYVLKNNLMKHTLICHTVAPNCQSAFSQDVLMYVCGRDRENELCMKGCNKISVLAGRQVIQRGTQEVEGCELEYCLIKISPNISSRLTSITAPGSKKFTLKLHSHNF